MMAQVRAAFLDNPLVLEATVEAVGRHASEVAAAPPGTILPTVVLEWLARLRLLEGVPFAHLVPDSALLPPESVRFFYVDRDWTDMLVLGALAVSTVTTLDREHLQALYTAIRGEIDTQERLQRLVGADPPGRAAADTITGFLLRSRAVSGWPGLHVRAYREEVGPDDGRIADDDPRRTRLLRLERLAPAVLLALFDGIPAVVHVEEPRQGIQFGVDLAPGAEGTTGATIPLRDVRTADRLDREQPPPPQPWTAPVPFRAGAPGVVHVTELARRIAAQGATHTEALDGQGVSSAEFALEMLQFPFRQVFGDPELGGQAGGVPVAYADLFRPTVGIETIRTWNAVL
jgi:hypothetical protein